MLRRRCGAACHPVHKVGIGYADQGFEPVKLGGIELVKVAPRKATDDQIRFLGATVVGLVKQPFAPDGEVVGHDVFARIPDYGRTSPADPSTDGHDREQRAA